MKLLIKFFYIILIGMTSCAPNIVNMTPAVETETVREYFDALNVAVSVNSSVNLYDQRTGLQLSCVRTK